MSSKKTKPKKPKELSAKSLKNKIWPLCRQIIRAKYGNECYTCGRKGLSGKDWQTGHCIPSSVCGAYLKFDLRNLRPQCATCNIWRGGMGAVFVKEMIRIEGADYVNALFADRALSVKLKDRIEELLPIYQKLAKELL